MPGVALCHLPPASSAVSAHLEPAQQLLAGRQVALVEGRLQSQVGERHKGAIGGRRRPAGLGIDARALPRAAPHLQLLKQGRRRCEVGHGSVDGVFMTAGMRDECTEGGTVPGRSAGLTNSCRAFVLRRSAVSCSPPKFPSHITGTVIKGACSPQCFGRAGKDYLSAILGAPAGV